MIGNIREVFSDILGEADWMDEHTKNLAKEKVTSYYLGNMTLVLSYRAHLC